MLDKEYVFNVIWDNTSFQINWYLRFYVVTLTRVSVCVVKPERVSRSYQRCMEISIVIHPSISIHPYPSFHLYLSICVHPSVQCCPPLLCVGHSLEAEDAVINKTNSQP